MFEYIEQRECSETILQIQKDVQNNSSSYRSNRILSGDRPTCKLFTEFPFDDLTAVTKDITCTTELSIKPATINDTGIYICRSKIAFKSIGINHLNVTEKTLPITSKGLVILF